VDSLSGGFASKLSGVHQTGSSPIVGPADELALKRLEKSTKDFEELVEAVSA
jgi:hypothetical protein